MGIEVLETAEILQGIFNVIFVLISFMVGLTILVKYFQLKKRQYIFIGLIWIGISTPWMHGAITFVLLIFDITFSTTIRLIIAYVFIPLITVLWFITFTDFIYPNKKKVLIIPYFLIALICEIIFFIFLIVDEENLVGNFNKGLFTATYSPFTRFSLLFFLGSAFITFMIFAAQSLKSSDPTVKLKGKFLIIAFITYTLCAVLDSFAFFSTQPVAVVIIRILLMLSAIEFYFGWILPKSIEKILIK